MIEFKGGSSMKELYGIHAENDYCGPIVVKLFLNGDLLTHSRMRKIYKKLARKM